jgi:hypothetical protein
MTLGFGLHLAATDKMYQSVKCKPEKSNSEASSFPYFRKADERNKD